MQSYIRPVGAGCKPAGRGGSVLLRRFRRKWVSFQPALTIPDANTQRWATSAPCNSRQRLEKLNQLSGGTGQGHLASLRGLTQPETTQHVLTAWYSSCVKPRCRDPALELQTQ